MTLTFQSFVPLLNPLDSLIVIVITDRPSSVFATSRVTFLWFNIDSHLSTSSYHPRMPKQLLRRDSQVDILLETVVKKIFHNRGGALRDRRAVVLYDAEKRRHGIEKVIWWFPFKQLDYGAPNRPYI